MLGPFSHTPPPDDKKGKKVAWAVAWATLVMGAVIQVEDGLDGHQALVE